MTRRESWRTAALTSQTRPAGLTNTAKLPANYSSSQNISYHRNSIRSSASPSLFIVEDVQLQGTLNCQRNHRTHSTTIHPDAPGCHQGGHRLLPQLITLGSGSYTQQSTSHAIARAQAFTRPSSNSPRALATHWHTAAAAASGTVRVRLPGLPQNRATQDTSRASHAIVAPSNPTQPTHRPTLNFLSNSFSNINRIFDRTLELRSTAVNRKPSAPQTSWTIALSYVSYLQLLPLMIWHPSLSLVGE